jgi:hypothetical protein
MSQRNLVRKYPHRSGILYWVNSLNWDEDLLVARLVAISLVSVLSSIILDVSVTPDRGHEIAEFFCRVVEGEIFSLISVLSSIMCEVTRDRGHDVAVFGGETVAEELLEDGVTLMSVLSSIMFEVTRDRGVDIVEELFGGEMVAEESLEDGVTLISVLSSIMFEVTRDRGVDIAEELILIGLFDVVE